MLTELIGKNIKSMREKEKMSQQQLAEIISVTRPVISNWENGKSEPSSSQLIKLSEAFKRPTDEILGIMADSKKVLVIDTSALIKRPTYLDELIKVFDEVIVPQIVISELNHLKDKGKPAVKQKAWLAMSSIKNLGDSLILAEHKKEAGNNDEKIADIAIRKAKGHPNFQVFILSDDIYFPFLCAKTNNLEAIRPLDMESKFFKSTKDYDPIKFIEFIALIKKGDLNALQAFNLESVDINFHNPEDGLTPLITAVRNRKIKVVEFLLSQPRINLDAKDKHKYRFSAIHHATQLKNMKMIQLLTEYGADIDLGSSGKNAGNTALMVSAWSNFIDGVKFYLNQGACVNQQDSNGYTALFKACIQSNEEVINLLAASTDLNIRCRKNKKATDYLEPNKIDLQKVRLLFKED